MIITISGMPGSGKSTVGKLLAAKLGYRFYSMGDLRGKMATERGMTIDELNAVGEREGWTDRDVDEYQKKLGETEDNFVFDGLISFHFIPQAFKVFLDIDPRVAAARIHADARPDEETVRTVEERQAQIAKRIASNESRYQKHYGVTFRDQSKFDLVIDTSTFAAPTITVEKILAAMGKK